jgi:hypothetical protein
MSTELIEVGLTECIFVDTFALLARGALTPLRATGPRSLAPQYDGPTISREIKVGYEMYR